MLLFIFLVFLGLIPAVIANNKGRSFFGWWIYGTFLFIFAFFHALLIKPNVLAEEAMIEDGEAKRCPFCAEIIRPEARVCRFCGRDLSGAMTGGGKF